MTVTCPRCGTDFDPERETRGDAERCPSCGKEADVDAEAPAEPRESTDDAELSCGFCGRPLDDMNDAADHLERAHSVVTNALLANTAGIGGEAA